MNDPIDKYLIEILGHSSLEGNPPYDHEWDYKHKVLLGKSPHKMHVFS